ncbi:MAG TPA: NAD(P)-binding domain-containing protein, partial [Nitrospirota bacterium]
MRIGFLGMGIMGSAMAENLIKGGFDVTVWNRTPEKCGPLVELGAAQASSPKVVVDMCDLTFAMLADPTVAKDVCFGP